VVAGPAIEINAMTGMFASGRKQPLASPDIPSGECPLYPNTSHSDVNILTVLGGCF